MIDYLLNLTLLPLVHEYKKKGPPHLKHPQTSVRSIFPKQIHKCEEEF